MTPEAAGQPARVLALIPARYDSTRFPGKALARLAGRPMIQHVYERTARTPSVDRVVVATDDTRVAEAVRGFGGEAVLTRDSHRTGTDRIAEAAASEAREGRPAGWVLNVQGDEPLIDPDDLERLVRAVLALPHAVMGTLVHPLHNEAELRDPHVVKTVLDYHRRALYFSRAPVPWPREPGSLGWRHLGVYLYRADFLQVFHELPASPLAEREQLEQLRALEYGYAIHCVEASGVSVGVDVPEDVPRAEALLSGGPA